MKKSPLPASLLIVGTIALAGSLQFLKAKLIDWRNVFVFGLPGVAGTYCGAALAA